MATYAIGDLQGCREPFERLLEAIAFDPARDRLWLVGDLVNRGPDSLGALRAVRALGDAAVCVLGNHDLNLLAVAAGVRRSKPQDTLDDILGAPDRDELLAWLRTRPALVHDAGLDATLVHAGLAPQWTIADAIARADELAALCADERAFGEFLHEMYGDEPARWSDELSGHARLRCITNAFTRLRFCAPNGRMDFRDKGPPGTQREGLLPWFEVPGRRSAGHTIVFGHWSTLGARESLGAWGLDTGCVWGGALTALRLDDRRHFSVPCMPMQRVSD
ncbi:MAG: symmetrical bis(5'-nucleosyl)-tetraphosphatase [Chromatiales bacterium]|nr:symmetrical bis(5'-nucleosyl)-tetraphosphatase [Chromatiales bacterium]